jgi:uroporphyrinogen-III synthase
VNQEVGVHAESRWESLRDMRVIVTRPVERAAPLTQLLSRAGAIPIQCPSASFVSPPALDVLDAELARIGSFDWVVWTSVRAVEAVLERAELLGLDVAVRRARHAAIAQATARALLEAEVTPAFIAVGGSGRALGAELPGLAGMRVLLPRSDIAMRELPEMLMAREFVVTEVVVYLTAGGASTDAMRALARQAPAHVVTFCSPSAVRGFIEAWESAERAGTLEAKRPAVICLGSSSATAAIAAGWAPTAVAAAPTLEDLLDAMTQVVTT